MLCWYRPEANDRWHRGIVLHYFADGSTPYAIVARAETKTNLPCGSPIAVPLTQLNLDGQKPTSSSSHKP